MQTIRDIALTTPKKALKKDHLTQKIPTNLKNPHITQLTHIKQNKSITITIIKHIKYILTIKIIIINIKIINIEIK